MFENVKVGDWVQMAGFRSGLWIVVSVSAKQFKIAPAERLSRDHSIKAVRKSDSSVLGTYARVSPATKDFARRVAAVRYARKVRASIAFKLANSATLADIKRARKALDAYKEAVEAITEKRR